MAITVSIRSQASQSFDLSFNPAMQERDAGSNGNHSETTPNQKLKGRAARIRDQPPEQADIRDYHHAEPELELRDLLLGDIQFRHVNLHAEPR